jgi:fructose-specific phosphotransferase system IIC component
MVNAREIGPIGATARIVVGLLIVVLAFVLDAPSRGIGWWDVAAALVVLPLIATGAAVVVNALYQRRAPAAVARARSPWSAAQAGASAIIVGTVIALATALTFVTPVDRVAIFVFFGLSMVLAGFRGYEGCEVLALPNTFLRRKDAIWCPLYTPIDRAEQRAGVTNGP